MIRNTVIPLADINCLSKEIECIMCLHTANDSRMCIYCSVIVCAKCIETWIIKKHTCPKCFHPMELKDFVKCHLADKLVAFIEKLKINSCSIHSQETPRVYCETCKYYICFDCVLVDGQHIDHDYKFFDENYKKIITLNHKLLDFVRRRCKTNQDRLTALKTTIQTLLNDRDKHMKHSNAFQQTNDILIVEAQRLLDDYQQKQQVYIDAIKSDESIINDIEQRLLRSKSLSDQEEILQILQKHIPSKT